MTFLDLVVFEDSPVSDFVSDFAYFYEDYLNDFLQIDFLKLLNWCYPISVYYDNLFHKTVYFFFKI